MLKRWNWLITLWQREWSYWETILVKQLRIELIYIGVAFVVFVMSGVLTGNLSSRVASMPEVVLAFWGLPGKIGTANGLIFMKWMLLPLNVWIAWEACNLAMKAIWREEEQGNIYLLCNQLYTRYQIGIAKYTWVILSFIAKYTILCITYTCLAMVACKSGHRMTELKLFLALFGKGIFVNAMLISLALCHAMLHGRKKWSFWADAVILGSLVIGNLYKIRDLLEHSMKQSGKDMTALVNVLTLSRSLKWISPLSWLNPFTQYQSGVLAAQIIVSLVLSISAAAVGIVGYRIRKFE